MSEIQSTAIYVPTPEEWRPVRGYEGVYEVSSLGRVRRIKGGKGTRLAIRPDGICSPKIMPGNGYLGISLVMNGVQKTHTVHKLVAEAFLGLRPYGMSVNHIDGNKLNNIPANFEYVTLSENTKHQWRTGLAMKPKTMCRNGHEYTESNSIIRGGKRRGCRACKIAGQRKYKVRLIAAGNG